MLKPAASVVAVVCTHGCMYRSRRIDGSIHMQAIPPYMYQHPFQTVKRRALRRDESSITLNGWERLPRTRLRLLLEAKQALSGRWPMRWRVASKVQKSMPSARVKGYSVIDKSVGLPTSEVTTSEVPSLPGRSLTCTES